jgi:hypothetical protein
MAAIIYGTFFSARPVQNPSTSIIPEGTCEKSEYSGAGYFGQAVTCNDYVVEFTSDPPGEKVDLDDKYAGVTPFSIRFDGKYSANDRRYVNVRPFGSGQYVQTKMIGPGEFYPPKIHFKMKVDPQVPAVDVNVNSAQSQQK